MRVIASLGKYINTFFLFLMELSAFFPNLLSKSLTLVHSATYRDRFFKQCLRDIYEIAFKTVLITVGVAITASIFLMVASHESGMYSDITKPFFYNFIVVLTIRELGPIYAGLIIIIRTATFINARFVIHTVKHRKVMTDEMLYTVLLPLFFTLPLAMIIICVAFDIVALTMSYYLFFSHDVLSNHSLWKFWNEVIGYMRRVDIAAFVLKATLGSEMILFAMLYVVNRLDITLARIPEQLSKLLSIQFLLFFAVQFSITALLYYVTFAQR